MQRTPGPSPVGIGSSDRKMPTSAEARPISSIAVGIFETYGGGFLARFNLIDGHSRLLAFSALHAFDLKDQFSKGLAHFEKHGFVREPVERVLPLPAEDFARNEPGFEVGTWFLNMGTDGALWRLEPAAGNYIVLRLTPPQMASLLFEIECAIEHVCIIDLRPFIGMRWTEISRTLENHPGFRLGEVLRAFEFSIEIFRRNAQVLITHLEQGYGSLTNEQLRWDRRFQIDTFLEDAIHFLLNFVASACALVDHSRTFHTYHYERRQVFAHYPEATKARFAKDGLVQFVHKLRSLMLHVGLVGLDHKVTFRDGDFVGRVVLHRDAALVWDGWGSVAEKWLKEGPSDIDLLETVKAYVAKVEDFQAWYADERAKVDWRDLRYAEQLRRAVLAQRSLEEIPRLHALLQISASDVAAMRNAVGQFLNAEQVFELRHDEQNPQRWLPKAIEIARDSHFIPLDLCDALIAHFAPGAPLQSAKERSS